MRRLPIVLFMTFHFSPLISSGDAGGAGESKVTYVKAIYSLPVTLDPIKMNDGSSQVVGELIYEGLLRLNNDYGYENSLADSWTSSPDGKVLTFKLRTEARFHNGEPVEAADVIESLSRAVSADSKVFSYFNCIAGSDEYRSGKSKSVAGLTAIDQQTVQITLNKPFPPFLYVLAGATAKVLPRRHLNEATFFERPIGSGPFQFVSSDINSKRVILQKFSKHPRLKGNLDEIVLSADGQETALKSASKGTVNDLVNWPLNGKESVFRDGQHLNVLIAGTWIIGLNSRTKPFEKLSVRKAFRDSFDAEKFRLAFYPDAEPAVGYLPRG
ncbi:MAG: ABC transporter substrate-binding protein, partial [Proteobacteria bacterium]